MLRPVKRYVKQNPRLYSVRWLETRLDEQTTKIIKLLEQVCFIPDCGKREGLQCGHLFERRFRPTRWDIDPTGNNHAQCEFHNSLHEEKPEIYRNAYTLRFGERAYHDLAERAHSKGKITYIELVSKWEEYKLILAQMKGRAA